VIPVQRRGAHGCRARRRSQCHRRIPATMWSAATAMQRSSASSDTRCGSNCFSTGSDSPVSEDSSTSRSSHADTAGSAGTPRGVRTPRAHRGPTVAPRRHRCRPARLEDRSSLYGPVEYVSQQSFNRHSAPYGAGGQPARSFGEHRTDQHRVDRRTQYRNGREPRSSKGSAGRTNLRARLRKLPDACRGQYE